MSRLAILGAGGHGKVVAEIAMLAGWAEVVFFDRSWPTQTRCELWNIEGDEEHLLASAERFNGVAVAIGDNDTRGRWLAVLTDSGVALPALVHPRAIVSQFSRIGEGSLVGASAVLNPFATIERGAIVNTGAVVEHDCVIGPYVHVGPGAVLSGAVRIGERSHVGAGSVVRQGISIGVGATVGAGSVVITDVPPGATVVGVPAGPIARALG